MERFLGENLEVSVGLIYFVSHQKKIIMSRTTEYIISLEEQGVDIQEATLAYHNWRNSPCYLNPSCDSFDIDDLVDVEIDADPSQYPDFEDAYITSASWKDPNVGMRELTDDELERIEEAYPDFIQEKAINNFI